jgi:hypothetical protein
MTCRDEGERPTASLLLLAAERSGGNPLLAEEVLAARRELSGVSLGSSLDELVAARLALRTPECRRALRLLALAGEPLERAELQRAAAAFEVDAAGLRRAPPAGSRATALCDLRAGSMRSSPHHELPAALSDPARAIAGSTRRVSGR